MTMQIKDTGAAVTLAVSAVLTAALIGSRAGPQQPRAGLWYARLNKPSFTPSGATIGGAWMVLYGLLGYAGYRLARARPTPARTTALASWGLVLGGIALFPFTFFRQQNLPLSQVVVGGMFASAATAAGAAASIDRPAALAIAPVVAWTAFAGLLNEELWRRN